MLAREIINNHGGVWSDNNVAMITAIYKMKYPNPPAAAAKIQAAPGPGRAPRLQDLQPRLEYLQRQMLR